MDFYNYMALRISKMFNGDIDRSAVNVDFDNPACSVKIVVPPISHNNKVTVDLWGRLFLYKNFSKEDVVQNQEVIKRVFDDSGFDEVFFDTSSDDIIDLFTMDSQQTLDLKELNGDVDNLSDKDMKEYFDTSLDVKKFLSAIGSDILMFRRLSEDAVNEIKEGLNG